MNLPELKYGMLVFLAFVIVLIVVGLLRRSKLVNSAIDLDDLLLGDDGRMSKAAAVLFVALTVTTWGMVYMWMNNRMTEGYFGLYLTAWVAPTVTALITKAKQAAQS